MFCKSYYHLEDYLYQYAIMAIFVTSIIRVATADQGSSSRFFQDQHCCFRGFSRFKIAVIQVFYKMIDSFTNYTYRVSKVKKGVKDAKD